MSLRNKGDVLPHLHSGELQISSMQEKGRRGPSPGLALVSLLCDGGQDLCPPVSAVTGLESIL